MSELFISKASDAVLIRLIDALLEKYGEGTVKMHVAGILVPREEIDKLRQRTGPSMLITGVRYTAPNDAFVVNVQRNAARPDINPIYHDVLAFEPKSGTTLDQILEIDSLFREHLVFPKTPPANGLAKETLGIIDRETAALAELHHRMITDAQNLRAEGEKAELERQQRFSEMQAGHDEDIRKREQEASDRIAAQQGELDSKIAEFDLSDHMRARRKQREEITAQVQDVLKGRQSPLLVPQS